VFKILLEEDKKDFEVNFNIQLRETSKMELSGVYGPHMA